MFWASLWQKLKDVNRLVDYDAHDCFPCFPVVLLLVCECMYVNVTKKNLIVQFCLYEILFRLHFFFNSGHSGCWLLLQHYYHN